MSFFGPPSGPPPGYVAPLYAAPGVSRRINLSLAALNRSISDRIDRENEYIGKVRHQLMTLLNAAGPCVAAAASAAASAGVPNTELVAIQNALAALTTRLNDEQPFTTTPGSVDANVGLLMNPIDPYIRNLRKHDPTVPSNLSGGWLSPIQKTRRKRKTPKKYN
jgi:hypothetical protein